MNRPTPQEIRKFEEYEKKNKHLRAPFGGCKLCGGGYWHTIDCVAIKKKSEK